jgi:peroxiredoxin
MAIVLLSVIALVVTSCSGSEASAPTGINEGLVARDFSLPSLDGGKISLSDYRGKVVLVNFWATWCPPCRAEIPDIEAAYRARSGDGFVVLGINGQESRETVQPFVEAQGMTYPILLDEQGRVASEYRVLGMPMSLMIDREGVIRARHVGYLSASQLDRLLAEVETQGQSE